MAVTNTKRVKKPASKKMLKKTTKRMKKETIYDVNALNARLIILALPNTSS